ncbi:MAG: hypothetical protein II119_01650 [Bacilli bacterium]|nr:hypothetical protein [Bacilli bacterium]
MKKKRILYIFIVLIFAFLILLTIYKNTKISNSKSDFNDLTDEFYSYELFNYVDNKSLKINDTYLENIIKEDIRHYEYEFKYLNTYKYGTIEINNDNHIVVYDGYNKTKKIFNDDSFKSLYIPNFDDKKSMESIYALSYGGNVYSIIMTNGSIENMIIRKFDRSYKVLKFLNLVEYSMFNFKNNSVIVLNENNEIYDLNLNIPYNEKNSIVGTDYIIYDDGSVSTFDGKLLNDSKSNKYFVKYVLNTRDILKDTDIVLITTDNHLIYAKNGTLYVYNSLVKNIEHKDYTDCKITFDNNKSITIKCYLDENRYNLDKIAQS